MKLPTSRLRGTPARGVPAAVALCPWLTAPTGDAGAVGWNEQTHAAGCQAVIARCETAVGIAAAARSRHSGSALAVAGDRFFQAVGGEPTAVLAALAQAHQWARGVQGQAFDNAGAGVAPPPGVIYTPAPLALRVGKQLRSLAQARLAGLPAPRVLDPAVGCGSLLLGWLAAAASDAAARCALAGQLHGWDLDPVAVAIARGRLLCACADADRVALADLRRRLQRQLLVADGLAAPADAVFDVVVANPPFQFLSGKASPVARLAKRDPAAAVALASRLAALARQYPASSRGCRDLYKWFIETVVRLTRPGGVFGLITPNTWVYLANFRDVRRLLVSQADCRSLWDLGFGAFDGATLGTAVLCAERVAAGCGRAPAGLLRREAGREVRRAVEWRGGDFEIFRSPWARALYARRDLTTLGTLSHIAEGEHGLQRVGLTSRPRRARGFTVPILTDGALRPLQPPPVAWWPQAVLRGATRAEPGRCHCGPRVLLRKTGAGLVCAPVLAGAAWAHQNLYVLLPRMAAEADAAAIPAHWLALWLTAEPVQRLYREGPHGQPGRPLAQLRVASLERLPAPPPARWRRAAAAFEQLWRTRPADAVAPSAAARRWHERLAALATRLLARVKATDGANPTAGGDRRRQLPPLALRAAGSAVH